MAQVDWRIKHGSQGRKEWKQKQLPSTFEIEHRGAKPRTVGVAERRLPGWSGTAHGLSSSAVSLAASTDAVGLTYRRRRGQWSAQSRHELLPALSGGARWPIRSTDLMATVPSSSPELYFELRWKNKPFDEADAYPGTHDQACQSDGKDQN